MLSIIAAMLYFTVRDAILGREAVSSTGCEEMTEQVKHSNRSLRSLERRSPNSVRLLVDRPARSILDRDSTHVHNRAARLSATVSRALRRTGSQRGDWRPDLRRESGAAHTTTYIYDRPAPNWLDTFPRLSSPLSPLFPSFSLSFFFLSFVCVHIFTRLICSPAHK